MKGLQILVLVVSYKTSSWLREFPMSRDGTHRNKVEFRKTQVY